MEHKDVDIYIDRVAHKSPEHTTGAALYILGNVDPSTHDLWREEKGEKDDSLVENNTKPIHLIEWEHYYSAQKNLNPGNGRKQS
jgi:hypothetical protein